MQAIRPRHLNPLLLLLPLLFVASGAWAQSSPAPSAAASEAGSTAAAGLSTNTEGQVSPAPPAGCALVQVEGLRPGQGQLMLAAYGDAGSYGKVPMAALRVKVANASSMQLQLCGLSGERVALSAFQDLDGDGKMARNALGMPLEPWGASGKPGPFGPTWDNSQVELNGTAIAVRLSS